MGSERPPRPRYDERYKKLFGHKRMIEDLLRAFVRAGAGGGRLPRGAAIRYVAVFPRWTMTPTCADARCSR